ncbi:hypothetical protein OMO38_04235 [Chryseobacterium sp. 09-1422]|uniref:AAA domain-containing protein n=1 Tax=Chryseobacterium kimseyorum TaxID=2984028 RepID=A0ABT3HVB2_9FLAO|nr:hypothetical protein [Chryseobacterium kimseyorum]MCW3167731.1 hypothetical protein [Chryseobacterium kimseyorum]
MDYRFTFQKHILIVGKTEEERHKTLAQILENNNLELIRFPKSMKSLSDYLNIVQAKKLFSPFYEAKRKYNDNQIFDFHIDWIAENNSLFVFEEFQNVDDKFSLEIMRIVINNLEANHRSGTKIIMTLEDETGLINRLGEIVNETEYKTKTQVVESNLQIIAL